jgi:hypothetical protein
MVQIGTPLADFYDCRLAELSLFIAIYAVFDLGALPIAILASLVVLFVAIRKKMGLVHELAGRCTPRARSGRSAP